MASSFKCIYNYPETLLDTLCQWNDTILAGNLDNTATNFTDAVRATGSSDRSRAKEMYRIGLLCLELTKGEIGLDSFTADGLVIIGEGYGDPEHSGLDEMFGLPDDDDFRLYKCGEEGAPYRYAYYVATDYDRPWIPVEKLLGKGCRSIIIDFSRNMPDDFRISIPRLLREHGHFIVVPSAG